MQVVPLQQQVVAGPALRPQLPLVTPHAARRTHRRLFLPPLAAAIGGSFQDLTAKPRLAAGGRRD